MVNHNFLFHHERLLIQRWIDIVHQPVGAGLRLSRISFTRTAAGAVLLSTENAISLAAIWLTEQAKPRRSATNDSAAESARLAI